MSPKPNTEGSPATALRNQVITRPRKLDTTEAADVLRVRPQTLRHSLCLKGHYMGLRPVKLPNGRLLWEAAAVAALASGDASGASKEGGTQ